jgi:hypothetical protein
MPNCASCGTPISDYGSKRCKPCAGAFRRETRPDRVCACGCGDVLPRREYARQYIKKYLPGHGVYRGAAHHLWKGGRTTDTCGYIRIYLPEHREADRDGYVREHRVVYELHHGVCLLRSTSIHHLNGCRTDNRPENLLAMPQSQHMSLHRRQSLAMSA